MNNLEISKNLFENIKHIDEDDNEYWNARELQKVLGYSQWRKFNGVIEKAKIACIESKNSVNDNFAGAGKIVKTGISSKIINDYRLSRYACYLITQNCDPRKQVVALAQTYFAIQTRKQELLESNYNFLTEDEKRFIQRRKTKKANFMLNQAAKNAGVKNFDIFHNYGYKGLYNGETADDIAKRKGLRYREDILDNMGSSELIANLFRIDLTNQKLIKDKISSEINANKAHYDMGKIVRKAIKEANGTMPENLPTPKKSLKELEKENKYINNK